MFLSSAIICAHFYELKLKLKRQWAHTNTRRYKFTKRSRKLYCAKEHTHNQTSEAIEWGGRRAGRERICLEFLLRQANLSITVWHSKITKEKDRVPIWNFFPLYLPLFLWSMHVMTNWKLRNQQNCNEQDRTHRTEQNAHGAPLSIWIPFSPSLHYYSKLSRVSNYVYELSSNW